MNEILSVKLTIFIFFFYKTSNSSSKCTHAQRLYDIGDTYDQSDNKCRICTCVKNNRNACVDKQCEQLDTKDKKQLLCWKDFKCQGYF